ncbi:hypothetical protein WBQ88_16680 [Sphingopyxis sp. CCNWLW253]|uniref:hypothetical protein n=1 Tax=unclassified Sphingopyxis TaxID=2614943 RepID=UPI0030130F00
MSLLLTIAAVAAAPAFPENVEVSQRYDCTVAATRREKRRPEPYPAGDYVFLFPAQTGLIVGKSIPYIHTRADGRTYFKSATIEAPSSELGPSFGFALRTQPRARLAFATSSAEDGENIPLRGSYLATEGGDVELEGRCRVRNSPVRVDISSP